jgi:hypothetical protein
MVGLLGNAVEITAQQLASTEWKLEAHYLSFAEEDTAMTFKVHPDEFEEMPDTEEHFRPGVVKRFKWPKCPRMCRFCRTQGLYWYPTERGFKLFSKDNKEHTCPGSATMY